MMDRAEKTRTILVDEDNALMRKLFVRCLEEGGFSVVETADPVTVLDLMRDRTPDLVAMDIVMPGLSGLELIKCIRADGALSTKPREFQSVVAGFLAA
ncbi:response regulator [Azospirillum sp. TSO35-2]|uniref:response regulator n=1 Tax=Azospirillum sp. TSO35-2 TaxID=716796 RepID=UPI000D65E47F|nr:response regulator [Azospirillum sp. TSO35-2]